MARRRSRHGRRGGTKIPIVSTAIVVGQALAAKAQGGDLVNSLNAFQRFYTGFNLLTGAFEPSYLAVGYAPWLIKRFVMPIARPRFPIRGVPISLS
jgi:hypothetical protein